MKPTTQIKTIFAIITLVLLAQLVSATVVIDSTSTDPSVIAAGDEVLLSVNFHDDSEQTYSNANRENFRLSAELMPGDTVSEQYITILDGKGAVGHLFIGKTWTKTFRVKVQNDAPVGTYQFKMRFQYYKDDLPFESPQNGFFTISVNKEGIILNLANIVTTPSEVRPGDNYVVLNTYLENSGRKDAKAVEFTMKMPEGFTAPYSNDNRIWAGYIAAGEQKVLTTYFNVDETVRPGSYDFNARFSYHDNDDNAYEKNVTFPVLVRDKPVIVITKSEGELFAGGKGELRVTLKNIGSEKAESVDVRLVKESSQPFAFDARSDFVGTLQPGEEATAVFMLKADPEAAIKKHSFTALVRAKGDSDKGDDNIYTFSREASIDVTGKRPNPLLYVGAGALIIVILVLLISTFGKRKKKR
ncbi:hypothetical protein GOV07_04665 [Candidatus Woesearchaeota archaeon]|nr:hypothetical protein [Candidatus Woesearchaeota archaeon]